ncbi:hypothetical protein [Corynebacterium sp.]|uniref:hypothetical protein n=1 Tax=Corynebacterium sp. TaxID=1720 RepID=UPI003B3A7F17
MNGAPPPGGHGALRPSDLPDVVARYRSLTGETGNTGATSAGLCSSTQDLRLIDAMMTADESRARSPQAAAAGSLFVVVVAGLFIGGGLWLAVGPPAELHGVWPRTFVQVVGALLLLGGSFSGALCLTYLWAGVAVRRRCARLDRVFRASVGGLVADSPPADIAPLRGSTRRDLVDQLEATVRGRRDPG